MKIKKSKLFVGLICCVMLMVCFLFVPTVVYAEDDSTPTIAIKDGETFIENSKTYPYPTNNKTVVTILCVTNFAFQQNDSVAYYYFKNSTEQVMYTALGSVEYKDEEGKTNCELSIDLFAKAGSGSYKIKAVILRNNSVIAFPNDFLLTINYPSVNDSTWEKNIIMDNLGVLGGEYPKYYLTAQLKKNKEEVNISNYQIDWYYSFNNQVHFLGSGETVYWAPTSSGDYVITYSINTGSSTITKSTDTIPIAQNYSTYAIIALSALALVTTTIVVISVARKVKKERVW